MKKVASTVEKMVISTNFVKSKKHSIYIPEGFDVDYVDYSGWSAQKSALFSSPTKYCTPEDFQYKLPSNFVPEFAFVGRSNVGKSSLIKSLVGPHTVVRVSKEPGCTRSVNYYAFHSHDSPNSHKAYLVDLPGYGFARSSKQDQQRWKTMIEGYLRSRDQSLLR